MVDVLQLDQEFDLEVFRHKLIEFTEELKNLDCTNEDLDALENISLHFGQPF